MTSKNTILFFVTLLFLAGPLLAAEKVDSKAATEPEKHPTTMSLEDLGFTGDEIKSDPRYQSDLQTRSDMLKIHQTLGLITAVPMTAEYVLGLITAGNVENGSTDTGLHATLGISTALLYGTTAMFAILAPKPNGLKPSGNTATHTDLAWIHAPLMILVPILGDMANDKISQHQPAGDLGTLHFAAATALLVSYLTSLTVITF